MNILVHKYIRGINRMGEQNKDIKPWKKDEAYKPHPPLPAPFPPGHCPNPGEGIPPKDWKEIPPDWQAVPPDWSVEPPSGKYPDPPEPPHKPPQPPFPPHHLKHIPRDNYCCAQDMFMADHEIQNIPQLIAYIKGQLGSPVICVEISDAQLIDIIRDMVQYIQRYYYREGNYRDYLCMELQPGKTHYKLCQELESVVDFQTASWLGNINELFTISHNILYDQMMGMNNFNYNGMCYGDSSYGDVMGNFNAQLVWLEQVKFDLGESYQVRYNMKEKELSVWPTPKRPVHGLIEVVKKQKSFKIFNDYWFKELVVCKAGMIWTNALRKYSLTIAGGGQLNGDSLYSSYKERYDAAIERIDKESPHGFIYVG